MRVSSLGNFFDFEPKNGYRETGIDSTISNVRRRRLRQYQSVRPQYTLSWSHWSSCPHLFSDRRLMTLTMPSEARTVAVQVR